MVGGGGQTLNLSLLSRGIGEVQQNGHEKVEVFLEPEDYFNFVRDRKRLYLPPIKTKYFAPEPTETVRTLKKLELPKTFTTRRGALLLFSEDFAIRNENNANHHKNIVSHSLDNVESLDLKTVDDLAKSILSYGKEEAEEEADVFLGFVHKKRKFANARQIRPGFSAKRYLSTWTRIWDDNLLENVISKGYITERSLFYGSMVAPSLRRRIFHDDLSHYPQPYRLMKNMLISPGSLSGYTFYMKDSDELEQVDEEEEELEPRQISRQKTRLSIAVVKTRNGVQREVNYSNLDKESQKDVLTDLLVKSAVNYALQKQQEFVETMKNPSPEMKPTERQMDAFDMKEAVESLLETEKENRDFDNLTQSAANNLSSPASSSTWPYEEYRSQGQLPSLDDRSRQLSTILDVSREGTGLKVLPPIGHGEGIPSLNLAPPTPKDTLTDRVTQTSPPDKGDGWATELNEDSLLKQGNQTNRQGDPINGDKTKLPTISVSKGPFQAQFASDMENITPTSRQPPIKALQKRPWGGSTHSLKSLPSKRSAGSVINDGSLKGSLIAAPGGEIVRVGGSVAPSSSYGDVANLNEVTPRRTSVDLHKSVYHVTDDSDAEEAEPWPASQRSDKHLNSSSSLLGYRRKPVTEEGIVNALTEHAQAIAEHILIAGGGVDLEEDIRNAVDAVMKAQRINSAGPTAAEYKDLLKKSITNAVANATGLDVEKLALESDISDELIEALVNQEISADDVKVVKDPLTGRSQLTSSRSTSLKDGHLYAEANGEERRTVSIPSARSSVKDLGDVDIISYMPSETIDLSESIKSDHSDSQSKGSNRSKPGSSHSKPDSSHSKPASVTGEPVVKTPPQEVVSEVAEVKEVKITEPVAKVTESAVVVESKSEEPVSILSKPVEKSPEPQIDEEPIKTEISREVKSSPESTKSKPVKLEERDQFLVGKAKQDKDNEKLYGVTDPPPRKTSIAKGKPKEKKAKAPPAPKPKEDKKKKPVKKGKKAKKEVEEPVPPVVEEVAPPKPKEPSPPPPPKTISPPRMESSLSDTRSMASPESDGPDFIIIRDRSPSPEPEVPAEPVPSPPKQPPAPVVAELIEEEEEDPSKLNLISSKDARAAKRAAAAAKKREEVERKRKEREEESRKEKERQDRERQREIEAEEQRRKQEEARRLRKLQEEADRQREELESREREKRRLQDIEREKRMKEEQKRKFDEMRRRQLEDEQKRLELLLQKQAEEEEQWRLEEEKKAAMEEEERLEYERRMKEEEELRIQKEAEEKRRREEEAARLLEEERQKAIAEARKRMEIEARLKFNRSLQLEANGLSEHSHKLSEAFVFSYFEILQWLGLNIPEFELQKLEMDIQNSSH